MEKFEKGSHRVYLAGRSKAILTAIYAMMQQSLLFGAMAGVIYYASVLFQDGETTIGSVSAYLFYMLTMQVYFYIVGMTLGNMAAILGASDRIVEHMFYEPAINVYGGDTIDEGKEIVKGNLEFKDVKFCYPSKPDVQVLKGVSF